MCLHVGGNTRKHLSFCGVCVIDRRRERKYKMLEWVTKYTWAAIDIPWWSTQINYMHGKH